MVDYATLKQQAWDSTDVSDASVHMAISRLRQKLNQDSSEKYGEGLIRAHRGIGYSISFV
ncbi:MAG: winged helix-turn-helix domain-containing protein [Dehalococcoidia bacterium]